MTPAGDVKTISPSGAGASVDRVFEPIDVGTLGSIAIDSVGAISVAA
jgi:hypothetical protein